MALAFMVDESINGSSLALGGLRRLTSKVGHEIYTLVTACSHVSSSTVVFGLTDWRTSGHIIFYLAA